MASILTLEETAEYLKLSSNELLNELENNRIPGAVLFAGKWRIKKEILDRLFDGRSETFQKVINQPEIKLEEDNINLPEQHGCYNINGEFEKYINPKNEIIIDSNVTSSNQSSEVINKDKKDELPQTADKKEAKNAIAPQKLSATSIYTPGSETAFSSCVRGRIFAYNYEQKFGHARLADGRVVWIRSQHFLDKNYVPKIGDLVEFDMKLTPKGFQANSVVFVSHDGHIAGENKNQDKVVIADTLPQKQVKIISRPKPIVSIEKKYKSENCYTQKRYDSPQGTLKSQELYQKAALAVTEGRSNDARRLFKQAIEAGAGTQVYEAFFKMLANGRSYDEARNLIQEAIEKFPYNANLYTMFGQMERRKKNYSEAEQIFKDGLKHVTSNTQLQMGLAQTLVHIGTEESLKEAGKIFQDLDKKGRLNTDDGSYQRFKAFQRDPRANKVFEFFQQCRMKPGITGFSNIPKGVTDIVVEFNNPEFNESFGISGYILIRCFRYNPKQTDLIQLQNYLSSFGPKEILGLQDSRRVIINKSLAFVAVANSGLVRDHVMSILSEHGEAIVPLDDIQLKQTEAEDQVLRDTLAQYLGMRDLYSRTLPVSGRRFFGREKLLIHLTDEIHSGQFLGIYGLRKMGKTSLLYQLRDEKLREEAVAYIDLQSSNALSLGNCNPLYWELERDLYLRLHEHEKEVTNFLRLGRFERFSDLPMEKSQQSRLIFSEDIRSILDARAAGKISTVKRFVIVLDELERMLPVGGQSGIEGYIEFFGLLRGLAQTERYRGLLSSIVVAANASISERGYWEGRENPVFALYKPVFLPPFTIEECNEMIETLGKNMSVYWENDALKTIFAETGGHPFLTRIFCSKIVKQYSSRPLTVTGEMVKEQVIPFIRTESDKLEQITELLRTHFPDEEIYLNQIALEEIPESLPDEALRHLLGYNLISSDGKVYQITINLLKRWLRRRAGEKD